MLVHCTTNLVTQNSCTEVIWLYLNPSNDRQVNNDSTWLVVIAESFCDSFSCHLIHTHMFRYVLTKCHQLERNTMGFTLPMQPLNLAVFSITMEGHIEISIARVKFTTEIARSSNRMRRRYRSKNYIKMNLYSSHTSETMFPCPQIMRDEETYISLHFLHLSNLHSWHGQEMTWCSR